MMRLQPGSHICHLVQAVSGSARSFLGPHRSLKCVVDDESPQDSAIVGDVQAYLHAVDGDRTATTILLEGVQAQLRGAGSGGTWLIVWTGLLLQHLMELITQGVPLVHVKSGLSSAIDTCRKSFLAHRISIPSLAAIPASKASAVLYLEGCESLIQGPRTAVPAHLYQIERADNPITAQGLQSNSRPVSDTQKITRQCREPLPSHSHQQPEALWSRELPQLRHDDLAATTSLAAAKNPTFSSQLHTSSTGVTQDDDDEFAWFDDADLEQSSCGASCAAQGSRDLNLQLCMTESTSDCRLLDTHSLGLPAGKCGATPGSSIDPLSVNDPLFTSEPETLTGGSDRGPSFFPPGMVVECTVSSPGLSEAGEEDAFGWFFEEGALQAEREAQSQLRLLQSLARAEASTHDSSSNSRASIGTTSAGSSSSGDCRARGAAAPAPFQDMGVSMAHLSSHHGAGTLDQEAQQDECYSPLQLQVAVAAKALESGRRLEMQLAATALLALLGQSPSSSSSSSSSSASFTTSQIPHSTEPSAIKGTSSTDDAMLDSVAWCRNVRVVGMLGPSCDSCAVVLGLCLPLDLLDPDPATRVAEAVATAMCTSSREQPLPCLMPTTLTRAYPAQSTFHTSIPISPQPSQGWHTKTLFIESAFQITQQSNNGAAQKVVRIAAVKSSSGAAAYDHSLLGAAADAAGVASELLLPRCEFSLANNQTIAHVLSAAGVGLVMCSGWVSESVAAELWEGSSSSKRVLVLGGVGLAFLRSCAEVCGVETLGGIEEFVEMELSHQQGVTGHLAVSLRSTGHGSDRGHAIAPSITAPSLTGGGAGSHAGVVSTRTGKAGAGAVNRDMMVLQALARDCTPTASNVAGRGNEDGGQGSGFGETNCYQPTAVLPAGKRPGFVGKAGWQGRSYTTSNAAQLGAARGGQASSRCSQVVTLLLASPFQHVIDTMTVTTQASFRKLVNALQGWATHGEGDLEVEAADTLRAGHSSTGSSSAGTVTRRGLQGHVQLSEGQQHHQILAQNRASLPRSLQLEAEVGTVTHRAAAVIIEEPIWMRLNQEMHEDREMYHAAVAGAVADALEGIVSIVKQNAGDSYAEALMAASAVRTRIVDGAEVRTTGMDDVKARCSALRISCSIVDTLLAVDTEIFNSSE